MVSALAKESVEELSDIVVTASLVTLTPASLICVFATANCYSILSGNLFFFLCLSEPRPMLSISE